MLALVSLLLMFASAVRAEVHSTFAGVRDAYCPSDVRLLDRHGVPLHEVRVDPARRRFAWTPLQAVSPALIAAVVQSEDRRFYAHGGVDGRAVAAAIWQRLRGGAARGASTVSMQLAALLEPSLRRDGPRTLGEKWRQMRAAWALERGWSKDEILEAYLNLVSFRGELQGIGAASRLLFDKAPHGLSHAESAVLAALIRAPNAEPALLRRRASAGLAPHGDTAPAIAAAVDRVDAVGRRAGQRIALAPHAARRLLPQGGPVPCADAPSTLDAETQRVAAAALQRHLLAIRDRSARDAAVLVADNASGEVLAYVAGSGGLSSARYVDGIQARRQAGSTLKPFLYARALDRRLLTASSLLDDTPLEIAAGRGLFRPRNYDERFRGLVPLRTALAGSLNVPAVRALLLVGTDDFADQLRRLGFAGVAQAGDYYGPSLALGSADVTLWELVAAYRSLANGGSWTPLAMRPGAAPSPAVAVASPQTAFVVSDILADRESRAVTFDLESPLATRFWSAVKTGTSKDLRDNWCVGYSRRYTVGVWVGNFSGEPMRDVSGISGAAPIWSDVMAWLHRDLPSPPPAPPAGLRRAAAAAPARAEWYLAGTEPAASLALAEAPAIVAPADGSIIAIDPDIPAARQRVAFEARAAGDARWRLGDRDLGSAAEPLLWQPVRGAHTLRLVGDGERTLGTVRFEVRGGGDAGAPPA